MGPVDAVRLGLFGASRKIPGVRSHRNRWRVLCSMYPRVLEWVDPPAGGGGHAVIRLAAPAAQGERAAAAEAPAAPAPVVFSRSPLQSAAYALSLECLCDPRLRAPGAYPGGERAGEGGPSGWGASPRPPAAGRGRPARARARRARARPPLFSRPAAAAGASARLRCCGGRARAAPLASRLLLTD